MKLFKATKETLSLSFFDILFLKVYRKKQEDKEAKNYFVFIKKIKKCFFLNSNKASPQRKILCEICEGNWERERPKNEIFLIYLKRLLWTSQKQVLNFALTKVHLFSVSSFLELFIPFTERKVERKTFSFHSQRTNRKTCLNFTFLNLFKVTGHFCNFPKCKFVFFSHSALSH